MKLCSRHYTSASIVNINSQSSLSLQKKKYYRLHLKQEIFRLQKEERGSSSSPASPAASPPALNLSYRSEDDKHDDISDKSESELADIEDDGEEMDDNISEDNSIEAAASGNGYQKKPSLENGGGTKENINSPGANTNMLHFWQNIQGHIQDMVKTAITNAKDDDESKSEDSASHRGDGEKYSKYLISCGMTHLPGPPPIGTCHHSPQL